MADPVGSGASPVTNYYYLANHTAMNAANGALNASSTYKEIMPSTIYEALSTNPMTDDQTELLDKILTCDATALGLASTASEADRATAQRDKLRGFLTSIGWTQAAVDVMFRDQFLGNSGTITTAKFQEFIKDQVIRYADQNPSNTEAFFSFEKYVITIIPPYAASGASGTTLTDQLTAKLNSTKPEDAAVKAALQPWADNGTIDADEASYALVAYLEAKKTLATYISGTANISVIDVATALKTEFGITAPVATGNAPAGQASQAGQSGAAGSKDANNEDLKALNTAYNALVSGQALKLTSENVKIFINAMLKVVDSAEVTDLKPYMPAIATIFSKTTTVLGPEELKNMITLINKLLEKKIVPVDPALSPTPLLTLSDLVQDGYDFDNPDPRFELTKNGLELLSQGQIQQNAIISSIFNKEGSGLTLENINKLDTAILGAEKMASILLQIISMGVKDSAIGKVIESKLTDIGLDTKVGALGTIKEIIEREMVENKNDPKKSVFGLKGLGFTVAANKVVYDPKAANNLIDTNPALEVAFSVNTYFKDWKNITDAQRKELLAKLPGEIQKINISDLASKKTTAKELLLLYAKISGAFNNYSLDVLGVAAWKSEITAILKAIAGKLSDCTMADTDVSSWAGETSSDLRAVIKSHLTGFSVDKDGKVTYTGGSVKTTTPTTTRPTTSTQGGGGAADRN